MTMQRWPKAARAMGRPSMASPRPESMHAAKMSPEGTTAGAPPVFEKGATSLVTNTILTTIRLTCDRHMCKPVRRGAGTSC